MHNFQRSLAAAASALALAALWVPAAHADPTYYNPPRFKVQVKPNYPESARANHEVGSVFVKVLIGADGKPKSFYIKPSGHKDLDAEVLRVAKASSYYPATRNNKPTEAFYDFSYKFTLAGLSELAAAEGMSAKRLQSDPKNVPARLALIEASVNQGNFTQAEGAADDGVKVLPSDARLWAERGHAYYQDGVHADTRDTAKLKIASDSYDQSLRLDPKAANASLASAAYGAYAFNLMQARQYNDCLPYAEKAAQLSRQMQYRMLKGDCEDGAGNHQAALADYKAAQQIDDHKNATISSRLAAATGNAQLNMGDEAGGMESLNQAERMDPKAPFAYTYMATYYIGKGNLNAALNPLQKIAELQPKNVQAQINIGDIYVQQKNYAAAQAAYTKAQSIDPKSADAQFGFAELAAAQGNLKAADAALGKALAMAPSNAGVYNSALARMMLQASTDKQDFSGDAVRYGEAATKADPNNANSWYVLGIAYADQHKKDLANSALRKAFDLFKAKNDQSGMMAVNKQYTALNGKDNDLMTGQGRSERTNQAPPNGH